MVITIKFNDNIKHDYNSFEEIVKLDNYNDIIYLDCYNNNLSSLPELPNSLKFLYCSNNNLSNLPELPNSLFTLYCWDNKITNLPELPNPLIHFEYYNNPILEYIEQYFDNDIYKYIEHQRQMKKIFVNKIGEWFLDCKYNPKYLYCRKRLMKEYEELYT